MSRVGIFSAALNPGALMARGSVPGLGGMSTAAVGGVAVLLACWPVLVWYVRGSADGSNDPWGLLALATAAWVLWRAPSTPVPQQPWALPALGMAAYTLATLAGAPMALRALCVAGALVALGSAWRLGRRLDVPLLGLALLALPLTATLQFYAGYPLRVLAGTLALVLLQGNGLAVTLEGAVLWWDGRQIAIDAPCSGIRMLWAGAYLMVAASALFRFSTGQTLCAAALTLTTVVAANALRAAALFYLEAGLVPLPAWTHEAAGMAVFLAAGCTIVAGLHRIGRFSRKGAVC